MSTAAPWPAKGARNGRARQEAGRLTDADGQPVIAIMDYALKAGSDLSVLTTQRLDLTNG